MQRGLFIFILLLFFASFCSIDANAASLKDVNANVTLDGKFSDWTGKPELDGLGNSGMNPQYDIEVVKYITDNTYLYLYTKRKSGSKADPWNFSVVITDAKSNKNRLVNLFNSGIKVSSAVFDIETTFSKGMDTVSVGYNGQSLERTLAVSADGKEIEFRIPLKNVGLDGFNQMVQFAVLSPSNNTGGIYWLPNLYPITITTGSTGWQIPSILFFMGVFLTAFMAYRNSGHIFLVKKCKKKQ